MRPTVFVLFLLAASLFFQTTLSAASGRGDKFFVLNPGEKFLVKVLYQEPDTSIRVFETKEMNQIAQWKIGDFKAHTVQFSSVDSDRMLLAGEHKILTYRLSENEEQLLFERKAEAGGKIVQATFELNSNDIVWSTEQAIYKSSSNDKKDIEVARVDPQNGPIKTLTALSGQRVAVSREWSNDILVFSPEVQIPAKKIAAHSAAVVGVQSPKGKEVYSVDVDERLVIWDVVTRRIKSRLHLKEPHEESTIVATSLDDRKEHLLVFRESGSDRYGTSYRLSDLLLDRVNPQRKKLAITQSNRLYSANAVLSSDYAKIDIGDRFENPPPPSPSTIDMAEEKKTKATLYELAEIEAESENYDAALDFIKRISQDDPDYRKSRRLQSTLYDLIESKNKTISAIEQYTDGNYRSAKLLLQEALEKNGRNTKAKRYLVLVDRQLSEDFWLKGMLALLTVSAIAGGFWFWAKRRSNETPPADGRDDRPEEEPEKSMPDEEKLKHQFVQTCEETREMLKRAMLLDKADRYKIKWIEFATQIKYLEKMEQQPGCSYQELIDRLKSLQVSIGNISRHKFKRTQKAHAFSSRHTERRQEKRERKDTDAPHKEQQNYYQVLGVREDASEEEIKSAFRRKMKEYHPDRHNASDFGWIKEEAARMTRLVQEAYQVLGDPQKRRTYTP